MKLSSRSFSSQLRSSGVSAGVEKCFKATVLIALGKQFVFAGLLSLALHLILAKS